MTALLHGGFLTIFSAIWERIVLWLHMNFLRATAWQQMPKNETRFLDSEVELHIVFDYTIQRVPTRTSREVQIKNLDFNVHLMLRRSHLDEKGYPCAPALWHAERMFLSGWNNKHLPDVRLLKWNSHLKGDDFILSEYRVLLSPSID